MSTVEGPVRESRSWRAELSPKRPEAYCSQTVLQAGT